MADLYKLFENIEHGTVNVKIEIRCDYDQMNYEEPYRDITYEKIFKCFGKKSTVKSC